jgi:hypothetical protein
MCLKRCSASFFCIEVYVIYIYIYNIYMCEIHNSEGAELEALVERMRSHGSHAK